MTSEQRQLGPILRARRRDKRLSLRDLSAEIDVSVNTLSRVERGFIPDLKNFQRIVDWLELPADYFLSSPVEERDLPPTPVLIARHLRADSRLSETAADEISRLVESMYAKLTESRHPALAIHLRSAQQFTPSAGLLLSEILREIQQNLESEMGT